jgi:hypothetical protein
MSDKTYDTIKNLALFAAPIITLAASLCAIWHVPYCEAITATLAAIDTALGAVVLVAKKIYEDKKTGGSDNG